MKKIGLIIIINLTALVIKAQTRSYDTIPYALEYHQKRLTTFENEPIVMGKIIMLGNSITQFGDWKKLFNDPTIINRGIAGDNTFGVLNRLEDVITRQPSKLFIEIGINDISKNIPIEVIVENIFTIVTKVKKGSPESAIFIYSILPTNDSVKANYPDAYNKNNLIVRVNNQLMGSAKKVGFTYIDLFKQFRDSKNNLQVKYARNDGLHLNDTGYQLWIKLLEQGNFLKPHSAVRQRRNMKISS